MDVDLHPAIRFHDLEESQAKVIDLKATISHGRKTSYAGMINAGHELRAVRASIPNGGYLSFLDLVGLSQSTAWRYSRLAELNLSEGLTAARIDELGGLNATLRVFTVNDDNDLFDDPDDPDDLDERVFTVNDDESADALDASDSAPEPAILPEPAPGPAVALPDASAGDIERDLAEVPKRMATPVERPPTKDQARIALLEIENGELAVKVERVERQLRLIEAEAGDALQPKLAVLQEREATNAALTASIGEWQVKYDDLARKHRAAIRRIRDLEGK